MAPLRFPGIKNLQTGGSGNENFKLSEWPWSDCACKLPGTSKAISSSWAGAGSLDVMTGSSANEVVDYDESPGAKEVADAKGDVMDVWDFQAHDEGSPCSS